MAAHDWLADAVLYEIYPQSFADSDGDGIGDLRGVIDHLDHLAWLGVDTIWFNPCFASPFVDAGYDVSDYLRIAPRYGTNDDLVALVDDGPRARHPGAARPRRRATPRSSTRGSRPSSPPTGPRRTATATSGAASRPTATRRRPRARRPGCASPGPAPGLLPQELLRRAARAQLRLGRSCPPTSRGATPSTPRARGATARRCATSWLSGCDRGVAGFRVDMAFSLVKDDPGRRRRPRCGASSARWLDATYPDAGLPERARAAHRPAALGASTPTSSS